MEGCRFFKCFFFWAFFLWKHVFLKHFSTLVWLTSAGNSDNFFTPVMMHNHCNGKIVCMLESTSNGWNNTPKPGWLNKTCCGWKARTKWRARRRKFKPFHSLILMGSVSSLADKMDPFRGLTGMQREYREGKFISPWHGCRSNFYHLSTQL